MIKKFVRSMSMRVNFVPALQDNLMYLLYDQSTKQVAAIDPVEPEKLAQSIEPGYKLVSALTTHHHWDHSGGNEKFSQMFPGIPFYGGDDRIPALSHKVKHDDVLNVGNLTVRCLFTPCHTTGHICYFVTSDSSSGSPPAVFTGDTLFIGGCGRFFEGTPQQMQRALNEVLAGLPDDTLVYCGHEYSIQNLSFGKSVEPNNQHILDKLQWAKQMRAENKYTVPSTIADEKLTNPFMRVMQPELRSVTGTTNDVDCMKVVRGMKDKFKM
ncbi:hydroxyacylglutathione hydrolase, mitochondrial-like [Convolutriloba macropyga]|uniref:hydroxyacylglutathione hydrolase, mitochondrial-like n=1 Tax=Convolutriloba macropyga TaxID=536237 RepID=UPI003F51C2C2